jgi:hypothetical protein
MHFSNFMIQVEGYILGYPYLGYATVSRGKWKAIDLGQAP